MHRRLHHRQPTEHNEVEERREARYFEEIIKDTREQEGHQRCRNSGRHLVASRHRAHRAGEGRSGEQNEGDETQCAALEKAHEILVLDAPDQVHVVREIPALGSREKSPLARMSWPCGSSIRI